MQDVKSIEEIRKNFRNEWLLIAVSSVDEKTTKPLTGYLVDHASSPEPLFKKVPQLRQDSFVVYSDDWPDDLAACF